MAAEPCAQGNPQVAEDQDMQRHHPGTAMNMPMAAVRIISRTTLGLVSSFVVPPGHGHRISVVVMVLSIPEFLRRNLRSAITSL